MLLLIDAPILRYDFDVWYTTDPTSEVSPPPPHHFILSLYSPFQFAVGEVTFRPITPHHPAPSKLPNPVDTSSTLQSLLENPRPGLALFTAPTTSFLRNISQWEYGNMGLGECFYASFPREIHGIRLLKIAQMD